MVVLTRQQQLQSLQARRNDVLRHRDLIRRQNEDRLKKGLSRDAGLTQAGNLENRRAEALGRIIELTRQGFSFKEGQVSSFVRARVSGARQQFNLERSRSKRITRVARTERISRGQASRFIRSSNLRLKNILGRRPVEKLTSSDIRRLSPQQRRVLNIGEPAKAPAKASPKTIPKKKDLPRKPQGVVRAVEKTKGIGLGRTVDEIRQEVQRLNTKKERETITSKERLALTGASLALVSAQSGLTVETILKNPKKFFKQLPSSLKGIGSQISEGGKTFGTIVRTSPERATGIVLGNIVTFFGTAKAINALEKGGTKVLGKVIAKDIKTSALGVKTIKNVKGVGDIEITPRGSIPKLDVDPLKAVREAKLRKQLRSTPKIPKTSQIEKEILKVVKKRGDAVTGSFAQETLLKKQFARRHKDIDIVTTNQQGLKKAIEKKLRGRVRFSTLNIKDKRTGKSIRVIRVIDKRTNKVVADIDPLKLAEEGFIKKFGLTSHKGLKIVRPEARLASKVQQLGKITRKTGKKKIKKIKKDIELATGKKGQLDTPSIRGGFGFSKKELQKFVGKSGPITTAQINLLGKGILTPSQLKLKRWLFASPFDLKTGKAQFRVSRLGITKDNQARLLDLVGLGDEISFKKSRPQIYVFPKEKLFPAGKKLNRAVASRTSKGFVVPKFSSELEVVLGKGFIIKRGKTLSRVNIDGRIVPIIEMKKVRLTGQSKKLIARRSKTINELRKGKLSASQKRTFRSKLKREDARLNRQLKKETGLDYNLGATRKIKKTRHVNLKSKGLSSLPKRFRRSGTIFSGRSKPKPLSPKSRPPKSPPRSPLRSPPRSPSKSPVKSPPKSPPTSPPRVPPRIPPRGGRPGVLLSRRKIRRRRSRKRQAGHNVFARPLKRKGQRRPKLIKVNRRPLTKKRAQDTRNYILDTSLARTGRVVPTRGRGGRGRTGVPLGYAFRTRPKFRTHRIVKGKRRPLKKGTVIEKGNRLLDTRQERAQITLRKRIAQINKSPSRKTKRTPTQRITMLKNLEKARRVKAQKRRR